MLALGGCASPGPDEESEALRLGAQAYEDDARVRGLLLSDPELQTYLESLAALIAAQAPGGAIPHRIAVRRDASMDAMVLPDGAVHLNAGLLAAVDDEAQLALLIGHLLNRSSPKDILEASAEERSYRRATGLWYSFLGPLGSVPAAGLATSFESKRRALEDEADAGGMRWLAQAGFASEAAPALFTTLADGADASPATGVKVDPQRWAQRREHCASLVATGAVPANPGGRNDVAALRRAVSRVTLESLRLEVADGEYARASHDAERARLRYGETAPLHYLQGKSELLLGHLPDAEAHMRRALELDPSDRLARRGLGEVLLAKGDFAGAQATLGAYLEANGQAPGAGIALASLRRSRDPAGRGATLAEVKTVAIMPVEPAIPRLELLGDEDAADALEAGAAQVWTTELHLLRSRGFDARLVSVDETIFAKNPELRFQLTQVQKTGARAMQMLRTADRSGAQGVFRGALDEINGVAVFAGADALLLTHLEIKRTGAVRRLFWGGAEATVSVAICLVDANTGEVLYTNSSWSDRDPYSDIAEAALTTFKR